MIPALMSSHAEPIFPFSCVVVNTSKPSMACDKRARSRKGKRRLTIRVVKFIFGAVAKRDSSKTGTMPVLVGKMKMEAVATIFLDITGRKSLT